MSTRSSSSMEQGELEASPLDFLHDCLPSVTLNFDVHLNNSSHQYDSLKILSPEPIIDDEDALEIHPPQPVQPISIKRDKKDKSSRHRHKGSLKKNLSSSSIKERSKHSNTYKDVSGNTKDGDESHNHSAASSKELDRELQRRLNKQRREEQEQLRRRKSQQERERLEKLERERRRKQWELQREMTRIHEMNKIERQSRHPKKSDSKDKKSDHEEKNLQSNDSSPDEKFFNPCDHEEKNLQSNDSSPDEKFFNPLKIKSKFDDPSDSEAEDNGTPSLKSESKSTSAAPSHSPYELDSSPVPSPIENSLPNYYPALQGCRNVEEFHCLNRIEEGTYGVVYRAVDIKTEEIVALKRLKMEKEKEGFPITSLREINTLLKAQHVNIVTVREIVVGSNMDKIYIVMDYVEHDLKSLMEYMKEPFIIGEVKTLMQQLLSGVNHLHDNWIIHRDLKASNLLLSHKGILKIGDFGLAREYGNPLKQYTPIVVTLWYRSPELLLGTKEYSTPIDMWSVGCIYAELLTKKPLFPGKTEIDELNRIFKELGTPNEKIWPGVSELPAMKKCTFTEYPYNQLRQKFGSTLSDCGFDLMNKLLTYDPAKRVIAEDALRHDFFEESPLPVPPNMFPTWPARSEQVRASRNGHANSPKPPSGGKAYAKLLDDDDHVAGFHLNATTNQPLHASKGAGFALKF